jgi:hypothetical protein
MTPSQKRRAKRRKNLQRKGPREVQLVHTGANVIGLRLAPNVETLEDARKMWLR